jgi:membrane dipeptidase
MSPRTFDGHNDTLLDLHVEERGGGRSFFDRSDRGHIDLPRAREGNYAGGFFAIFVPNESTPDLRETAAGYDVPLADPVDHERAKTFTYDVLERLYRLEAESGGEFRVARSPTDLHDAFEDGAVVAVAHLEGACAVAPDLSNLDFLYAAGVRSIGLTWARPNEFATGANFAYPGTPDTGPGLTDRGRALVDACNDRGIVVDLAHLTEQGFWDAAECTDDPLVVSHSAVHSICPSTRNLTDEQLDAVGESNGVVGISFSARNLHPEGKQDRSLPLSTIVDHIEYVADRIGVDQIAVGSDFDGATVPDVVGDVSRLPSLFGELRDRGFDEADCRKLALGNWVRILETTWD